MGRLVFEDPKERGTVPSGHPDCVPCVFGSAVVEGCIARRMGDEIDTGSAFL